MKVAVPGGPTLNFPDDATKEEVQSFLDSYFNKSQSRGQEISRQRVAAARAADAQEQARYEEAAGHGIFGPILAKMQPSVPGAAVGGILEATAGMAGSVERGVGRITGWQALIERGDRVMKDTAIISEHLNRGKESDVIASAAAQFGAQMVIFGGAGKVASKIGLEATPGAVSSFGKALAKGAAGATAFQGAFTALDFAGAKTKEEKMQIIDNVPQSFIQAAAMGGLGGSLPAMAKSRKMILENRPELTPSIVGMAAEIEKQMGIPSVEHLEYLQEIKSRVEGHKITEHWLNEADKAWAKAPPIPVKTGGAAPTTEEVGTKGFKPAIRLFDDVFSGGKNYSEIVKNFSLDPSHPKMEPGFVDKDGKFYTSKEARAAGGVKTVTKGAESAPSNEDRQKILAIRKRLYNEFRTAQAMEKAARAERDIAVKKIEELTGKSFDVEAMTKKEKGKKATLLEAEINAVKARVEADNTAKKIVEADRNRRQNEALKYGEGGGTKEHIRTATQKLHEVGQKLDAIPDNVVDFLKPQTLSVPVLKRIANTVRAYAIGSYEILSGAERGNASFREQMIKIVSEANQRDKLADAMMKDIHSIPPSAREYLRLAFDEVGRRKQMALDEALVAHGEEPKWTQWHEEIRLLLQDVIDKEWGVQAANGLINQDNFHDKIAQMYKNKAEARSYFEQHPLASTTNPLTADRLYKGIFDAAAKSGGKLELKTYDIGDNIGMMIKSVSNSVQTAQIIALARSPSFPGALIPRKNWYKLDYESRRRYNPLPDNGGWMVRDDIWKTARGYLEPTHRGAAGQFLADVKHIRLALDFQHVLKTGAFALSHKEAWTNPTLWYDAVKKNLDLNEHVIQLEKVGNVRFGSAGGDYDILDISDRGGFSLRDMIRAKMGNVAPLEISRNFVFDHVIPIQRKVVAVIASERAFRERAAGHGAWKGMTDDQVYQKVGARLNTEFGTYDMKANALPAYTRKAMYALLAPEWNLSIAKMTLEGMREVGHWAVAKAKGQESPTDFYYSKRFIGAGLTIMAATAATNKVISSATKTDWNPEHDLFDIVTPYKDPKTGRNIRIATLGTQFQFWKTMYDVAEHELKTGQAGKPVAWAKDLASETVGFIARKLHPIYKLGAQTVAGIVMGPELLEQVPEQFDPISAGPIIKAAAEHFGADHMTSDDTAARAWASGIGQYVDKDLPILVRDDYLLTKKIMTQNRGKAKFLAMQGMAKASADARQKSIDAYMDFINRYSGSTYFDQMGSLIKGLGKP